MPLSEADPPRPQDFARVARRSARRSVPVAVLSALTASLTLTAPAVAQEQVRIGVGFGLAFLPTYICEDLKLVEKYAKAEHLDVKVTYQRLLGAGAMQEALQNHTIDVAPFGTAPLLADWERQHGTARQILAVSGLTTMPLTMVSNQSKIDTFTDLASADRIALPSLTSPQMYFLQMQSEKVFDRYDKLHDQVVALSPSASTTALIDHDGSVAAAFLSPPFSELALRDSQIHRVLGSADVLDGKASFLILGASRAYIEAHPRLPEVIDKAIDEAARLIHDDPRRAAQIYLTHEPSKALAGPFVEALMRELKDEFGSAVHGVQAFADFMGRHGELKKPPQSWKDVVAPALLNSPSG
jgi:NitT/TauT family transport system substrate-binding protein